MPTRSNTSSRGRSRRTLQFERLEGRECPASGAGLDLPTYLEAPPTEQPQLASFADGEGEFGFAPLMLPMVDPASNVLTDGEVEVLLQRAAAASASNDAIIAIVDRNGRILGVRTEDDVVAAYGANVEKLVFAIDGAVAKARAAALFANDQAPLTSRTIRNLSQSTITQREVQSVPNLPAVDPADPLVAQQLDPFDPDSAIAELYGPGFVAPIGIGGHFPQGVKHTPPVDLFGIEHQSRDSLLHPGADGVKGTPDDIVLAERFNIDPANMVPGQELYAPESYGYTSGRMPYAQARGIATLPGGIPIYKVVDGDALPTLVGGIGVFFPGPDGLADFEQGFKHASELGGKAQKNEQRLNAPRVLEAEWIAYAAVGGVRFFGKNTKFGSPAVGDLNGVPALPNFGLPNGRIDLAGIKLEIYGPNPTRTNKLTGIETVLKTGQQVGRGDPDSGVNQLVDPLAPDPFLLNGIVPSEGWIVEPNVIDPDATDLTAADIEQIVEQGIHEAGRVRAAIRLDLTKLKGGLPQPGPRTAMIFSIGDREGNVLGLYRMPDATTFSIDVAVAKARNTAYYANPDLLQEEDWADDDQPVIRGVISPAEFKKNRIKIDAPNPNLPDLYTTAKSTVKFQPIDAVAFSNRTFRYLAEPRYPSGVDGSTPGAFSSLLTVGVNRKTAENADPLDPPEASNFVSVFGYDAFHAGSNFRNPEEIANQNGVVFFPGSTPLYVGAGLQGGFGVSGDGVDQDDVVTFAGQRGFAPPAAIKADRAFYRGVRLPFQKFSRNPYR